MTEISDYELGQDLAAQKDLLMQAYDTADDDLIEHALTHVTTVRRMKKNGTLEWQNPDADF